ncbi:MMPL family transporter [Actinoplanes sp. HUAS TT8]|uniref:MMPL family transporter n=1 Tax=Actinoplanes sp. HUAS TT8 TaxID=3447453 RepID=UPI003F51D500
MFAGWGSRVARLRWPVLIVTLVAVVSAGVWGMGVFGQLTEGGYADPHSESARAADVVAAAVGGSGGDVIAIYTPDRGTEIDDAGLAKRIKDRLAALPASAVTATTSYWDKKDANYAAKDRSSAVAIISLAGEDDGAKTDAYGVVENRFSVDGATVQLAGGIPLAHTSNQRSTDDLGSAELISMPIVLILLLFIFGSLIAASLPVIVGGCAVLGSLGVLNAIALGHDVNSFAVNVASLLGLGMAIDYGLFMVGRFREEQAAGHDPAEAVRRTVGTAGRTVLFSATLLMTALAGLLLFPQGFLKSLAYGGLAAVFLAMVLSLTLLPAILAILGPRVDKLPVRLPGRRGADSATGWQRLAGFVLRRPVVVAIPILIGLIVLALPIKDVRFGENDERVLPAGDPSRVAIETLKASYPQFSSDGVQVVIQGPPAGTSKFAASAKFAAQIAKIPGVASVNPAGTGKDVLVYNAALATTDSFSTSARQVVDDIRALPAPAGTTVLVGGVTARNVDSLDAIGDQLPLMVGLLAGATLLLMFLAFGSILLPIKAVVMSGLSLSATFGLLVWLFQQGHGSGLLNVTPAPLEAGIVVLMAAVVFGLSTDYEVFLLSRMVEARSRGASTAEAVTTGLARTGRVISAAALLLIVVTGAFALSTITTMRFVGVGMIIALVLDATVVRMLLVPAVLALLGDAAWWAPGPLRRLQERAGLAEHAGEEPAPTASAALTAGSLTAAAGSLSTGSLSAGSPSAGSLTDSPSSLSAASGSLSEGSPSVADAETEILRYDEIAALRSGAGGGLDEPTTILPVISEDEELLVTAPDETSIIVWDPDEAAASTTEPTDTDEAMASTAETASKGESSEAEATTSLDEERSGEEALSTDEALFTDDALSTEEAAETDDAAESDEAIVSGQASSRDTDRTQILPIISPTADDDPSDSDPELVPADIVPADDLPAPAGDVDEEELVPAQVAGAASEELPSAEDTFNPWAKSTTVSDTASPDLAGSGAFDVTQVMPIYQAARRFTENSPTSTNGTPSPEAAKAAPEAEPEPALETAAPAEAPAEPEPDPAAIEPAEHPEPETTEHSEPETTVVEPVAPEASTGGPVKEAAPEASVAEPVDDVASDEVSADETKAAEPFDSDALWAQVEATLAAGAEAVAAEAPDHQPAAIDNSEISDASLPLDEAPAEETPAEEAPEPEIQDPADQAPAQTQADQAQADPTQEPETAEPGASDEIEEAEAVGLGDSGADEVAEIAPGSAIPAEVADAFTWMSDPRIAGIVSGGEDAGSDPDPDFTWLAATAALPTISATSDEEADERGAGESLEVLGSRSNRPATLDDFPARPRRVKQAADEETPVVAEAPEPRIEAETPDTIAAVETTTDARTPQTTAEAETETETDLSATAEDEAEEAKDEPAGSEIADETETAEAPAEAAVESSTASEEPGEAALDEVAAEAGAAEAQAEDAQAEDAQADEVAAGGRDGEEAAAGAGRPQTLGEWLHGDPGQRPRTLGDVTPVSAIPVSSGPVRRPQTLDEWLHGSPAQARPQSLDDWLAADNRPVSSAGPRPESLGDLAGGRNTGSARSSLAGPGNGDNRPVSSAGPASIEPADVRPVSSAGPRPQSLGDLPAGGKPPASGRRPATLADHSPEANRTRRPNGGHSPNERPTTSDRPTNSDHTANGDRAANGGPERQPGREVDPDTTGS